MKYQNYSHYKLPITIDPLKYGKLIEQFGNKYIIQLNTPTNIVVINQINNENFVRIFRKGVHMFEYKEIKISDIRFIRIIRDQKFTFENSKLISTEILSTAGNISPLYEDTNSVFITPFKYNIIKVLENTEILKNKKAELSLIFLLYLLCFVIFPESNENIALAAFSSKNIIKLRRVGSKYHWKDLVFNINNKIFSKILFENKFNQFWDKIENNFTENNHMFILFKIKYINGQTLSIAKLQRLNKTDKNWYSNFIFAFIELKNNYYKESPIESLIFSYGFKKGKLIEKETFNSNVNFQKYENNKLVVSYNPLDYGKLIIKNEFKDYTQFILQTRENLLVNINKFEVYNEVELVLRGESILKFRDELISDNKFIRILDNKKFYFENNKETLFSKEIKTKFISKTKNVKTLTNNFITIDIETIINDGLLTPYLIAFFDGKNLSSFYLSDFDSVEEMMLTCLKSLLIRKYNGYKIYAHNLAKFDIIFLLKYILKLGSINPIIHSGKIISLSVNYGDYQVEFKDSLLLLLGSLDSLSKSFKVEDKKSIFPHLFVNENNLNYIGEVPTFNSFMKVTNDQYNEYKTKFNNNWNLKNEAIKYNELDVISLYQVLTKFNSMIFELFAKNIHHYPTLSSLAFSIFRSNFMVENTIPQISGEVAKDIRSGYTGGAVDMYIPKSKPRVKIKSYDVNSLYPSQMQSQLMPIGMPTYFNGDIRKIDPNAFGFFYCKVIAPNDIKHPILQTRVKINGINKTIAPIGSWEDMLFSEELYNAEKYGYKFKILWGYTFESKNIFKDYVNFLYNLRLQYPKSDPLNFIAKILLNSLYGRFGMDDNFEDINVIHKDFYGDFENKFIDQITEKIEIDDYFIVFIRASEGLIKDQGEHNVSVGIAAAITAYSRIHMSQFKNNPKINLYYTDTDSIYTDSDIDKSLINSKILGMLKLENVCEKAIFLGPKLYALMLENGQFIHKIKGLNQKINIDFNDFQKLLTKDTIIAKTQPKWFRSLSESKIKILEQLYSIKTTNNKRLLVYDNNYNLIGTRNYRIDKSKEINVL